MLHLVAKFKKDKILQTTDAAIVLFKRSLNFELIDQSMDYYLLFETTFLTNGLVKKIKKNNEDFVSKVEDSMKKMGKEEHFQFYSDPQLRWLVDEVSYLLTSSCKRALNTLNVAAACAIINHASQIL